MKSTRFVIHLLLGGITLVALSCGEPTTVAMNAPELPQGNLRQAGTPSGLLVCSNLPAAVVRKTIGPRGGTLRVGPHTLSVPPGALAEPVTVMAVAPSSKARKIHFKPSGLTFARPVALAMSYENCRSPSSLPKRIAQTTERGRVLRYVPSIDNLPTRTVTGYLDHFSTYAVAW